MPENKSNLLDIDAILADIRNIVEQYKQEIEQQVQEGKDRTYEGWENIPQETSVKTQNITKPEEGRSLGIFPAPVKDKKPKKVTNGGEV